MICRCGRPRCTPADLKRWSDEFPDGKPHKSPPWAAAICWSSGAIESCNMKPLAKELGENG